MFSQLSRNRQLVALCAFTACLLGITAVLWPGITLRVLTLLFGAFALANGLLGISAVLVNMAGTQRCWVPIRLRGPFDR